MPEQQESAEMELTANMNEEVLLIIGGLVALGAVLSVNFFGETYPVYFRDFFTALFTMFQILLEQFAKAGQMS
eukprot:CAMPEP_0202808740 /NCGR_PEP_ID=MMETSP1389-20130828/1232_1 /ASSEMBLY_ACC=CAM_ASM_000865 /TAXON_ID=302021 /ORGANISM="Rhodomonas sp., Strain CCMP768" /LENGTH=72 /DNA_ID=CAMNT_0049479161 /DNA_START=38 /DNA_END=252 /DNA_ORIENTATION=+